MSKKKISHVQGKGSIAHNNRLFIPKNVDPNRTPDNIYYIQKPIAEAYAEQFDEAVKQYNAKQKRSDRKIKCSYYEYLFNHKPCNTVLQSANKQYSFYEDLVQIGTMDDTGIGSKDAEIAITCLDEYMKGFQLRNPNFIVINSVLHKDEATPHLHIDYFPIGHYKQGIPVQNGLAQALKEMGHGTGPKAISRWRESERKVLKEICIAHGIEVAEETPGRGYSMKVEEYKEHQDRIHEYEITEKALEAEIQPLLEAKSIADSVSVTGTKMPLVNSRMVSESEFEAITEQKKALAVQRNEVKELQNHFDKERLSIQTEWDRIHDEKSKLEQNTGKMSKLKKTLYQRKAEMDKRENEIHKQEQKAAELYDTQLNLNQKYENVKSAYSKLEKEYYSTKHFQKDAEILQYKVEKLEHQLDSQSEKYKTSLRNKDKDISAVKCELSEYKEKIKQSESEISKLEEKLNSLRSYIDKLFEIGAYMARKLRMNFEDIVNRRLDGYSLKHIFGDNGQER